LGEHLETVAADGLSDLAEILIRQERKAEANTYLLKAVELAEKRRARRIAERATLQRASLMVNDDPAAAIATATKPLEFFRANRYRRYEIVALSILSRAHERLGEFDAARAGAEEALRTAVAIKDDAQ